MADENNQKEDNAYLQPYFESSADFQFRIIDPDSKSLFSNFKELNKDIVTANLSQREIDLLLVADSIVGVCNVADPYLEGFQNTMIREMMAISNISKARDGFLLRRFTEHHFIKTDRFSKAKKDNQVGE